MNSLDRILDASLDRAMEGLRVLNDLVRFGLDDAPHSEALKHLRHALVSVFGGTGTDLSRLVRNRESLGDVGRPKETSSLPSPYRDVVDLFEANFRRVEEALRSLEEHLRVKDVHRSRAVENLRYRMYDLHRNLLPKILGYSHRRKMDFELYVVTDRPLAKGRPLEEVVRLAIKGGAGCIQLREKKADKRTVLRLARSLRDITEGEGVPLIVNDHLDIALETGADGVHLGQEDLPLETARRLSGGSLLIGISTHSRDQALEAQAGGAGYINIGPVFPTATKETPTKPVSVELVRELAPLLNVPFTTMGGIHLNNVEEVILAGADRVAVVSEVVSAADIEAAARKMVEAIRKAKEKRLESGGTRSGDS